MLKVNTAMRGRATSESLVPLIDKIILLVPKRLSLMQWEGLHRGLIVCLEEPCSSSLLPRSANGEELRAWLLHTSHGLRMPITAIPYSPDSVILTRSRCVAKGACSIRIHPSAAAFALPMWGAPSTSSNGLLQGHPRLSL